MANNRLFVRCLSCGAECPIARVSAGEHEWTPSLAEAVGRWPEFLIDHRDCGHDGKLRVELTSENEWLIELPGRAVSVRN